jgi:succinate dehydrogenase/fumarate reductase flavoprotein subunit
MTAELAARKWAFEIPPAPIAETQIDETIKAELVVVGEGMSGLCTALSAVEAGVDTVIVTASSRPVGRGGSVAASYSKVMKAQGYPRQEVENFYLQEFASASYNIDQRKWYSFYNNSETAMNWLIDMLEADGVTVVLEKDNEDDPCSPTNQPVGSHAFMGQGVTFAGAGIMLALKTLEKNYLNKGGRIVYNTAARQLVREDGGRGRVSAVIAENREGRYIRYSAKKSGCPGDGGFFSQPRHDGKILPGIRQILYKH